MNENRYLDGKMSRSDRRRSSKWDSKEEPRVTYENMHGSGKSGLSFHDRETRNWLSPGAAASGHSKWSAAEPLPGRRGSHRDVNIDEDRNRSLKRMRTWEEESHGTRMSPGLDHWRQQSRQRLPKNEWKRSRRSRSPSRSRSRSPIRGFGRDSGPNDNRSRSGASAQVCRDYASGWCKRGDHCRFLHGQTSQENWERQQRSVTPKYPMPRSHEYPKGNGNSSDCCIEFLKGSCRRGSSCRFAHHNDRRHRDGSLERHNSWEPPRAAEIACKYFAAGNCRNGNRCRFSHQDQTYPSPDKSRDGRVLHDHGSAKWGSSSDGLNLTEDKYEISGPAYRGETDRSVDKWGYCLEEDKKLSNSSNGDKINENKKNGVLLGASADDSKLDFGRSVGKQWLGDMDMWPEWTYNVQTSKPVDKQADWPNWKPDVTKQATVQMHDAAVVTPSKTNELYVKGMSSNTLQLKESAVGQGQIAFPNSGVITNPQIQIGVQEERVVNKPEIIESMSPHFKSGVSPMQNNVSTEQLTAISASIAQLLVNGQQFHQPYGSFAQNMKGTSPSPFGKEAPNMKDPALNMQSNETVNTVVVEKHEVNHNRPGFFPPPKNMATETLETTSKSKMPSSAANVTENKEANGKSSQVQLEAGGNSLSAKESNGKLTENTKVEEHIENGTMENNAGDEKTDDGKKGKEAKGVRAFKFALVEFVKEALKPAWQEGQMSKDAYKNTVKKVVDKVTGSIQEANIPQTQEKIQQYLSHSKPKLTKLVEAYVGKFQKDK